MNVEWTDTHLHKLRTLACYTERLSRKSCQCGRAKHAAGYEFRSQAKSHLLCPVCDATATGLKL